MPRHLARVAALATLLALLPFAGAYAHEEDEDEKRPKPSAWNVRDPGGPYRSLEMTATEGTWMSVDVHPDGSKIVFDLLGDLYVLPIEGGNAKRIAAGLQYDIQPRWSKDGKHVLFTSDRGGGDNLWYSNADGSDPKPLTKETYRLFNNGVWHPSGEYVIGKKHFTSRRSLGAGEMWMIPYPEGGKGVRLTKRKNDQQDIGEPAISPDGKTLYWSEDMSGGTTFQYNKDPHGIIYVIRSLDMETGEIRDLIRRPGGAIRPEPSPDGSSLAFIRRRDRDTVLSLYNLKTGRIRDLWDGCSRDQQETWAIFGPHPGFDWMPDGSAIVIQGKGGLWKVDTTTGKASAIPFKAYVKQRLCATSRTVKHDIGEDTFDVKVIRWPQQAANDTIVFQALGYLWRKEPGKAPVRLTRQTDEYEFAPWVTPDGKVVVYVTWHDTRGGRIRHVDVDGSNGDQPVTLVDDPGHYASAMLSGDRTEVLYRRTGPDRYRGTAFAGREGIWRKSLEKDSEPIFITRNGRKPRYAPGGKRIHVIRSENQKTKLVSLNMTGHDARVVAESERAADFAVSPDGRWLAFEELWQTYVVPLPPQPTTLKVGPTKKDLPVTQLSQAGGTYLSWSADSTTVHWSLGPELFSAMVVAGTTEPNPVAGAPGEEPSTGTSLARYPPAPLGWKQPADAPDTDVWFVGATVLPMHDESVIENGVVHVKGRRIVAVGTKDTLSVPNGAKVIDCTGTTLMPGIIDIHSHTGSSSNGIFPRQSWGLNALLAFGVTTVHDPSNNTQMIYAESELVRAGQRLGPRILSTGTILYGAEGNFKAVINSYEDALAEVKRTAAWGPKSVKSYQQPRRDQRQQILKACRELGILTMPEGGSTLHYNMTHLLDGHTTLEHAVPVAPLYEPALRLIAESGTCYTPTLTVGYGGFWGENYWYAKTDVLGNERLMRFTPHSVVAPNARRRTLLTDDEEYNHIRLARGCAEVVKRGGHVQVGAHGQLQGLGSHWELWMFEQGGMTPHQALRSATYSGAKALCLEDRLGSIRPGMLADLIVVEGEPLKNVRDSERIRYTMANGRLYDARTLEQILPTRAALPQGPPLETIRGTPGNVFCVCGR
ncbi:MAG: amidohydrolase family protein [Planctomycetota bacterium]|nr:amidohydrolase family protein [Planctomycetota bacterium]